MKCEESSAITDGGDYGQDVVGDGSVGGAHRGIDD